MQNPQVTKAELKNLRADELITAAFAEEYGNSSMLYEELLNAARISPTIQKDNNPALWKLCSQLFGEDKELQQLLRQKIIHLTLMGLSESAIPCTQETVKEKLNATMNLIPSYEHKIFLQHRIELDLAIQEGEKSRRLPIETKMASSLDNLIAITNLLAKYGVKKLEVNDNKYSLLKKRDHLKSYIISLPSTVTNLDLVIGSDWANNEIIDPFLQTPADILQKINLVIVSNPKNNLSEKTSLIGETQHIFQRYLKTSDFVGAKSIIKVMRVLGGKEVAQSLQQRLNDISKGNWSDKATHPIITPEPEPSSVSRMVFREWH